MSNNTQTQQSDRFTFPFRLGLFFAALFLVMGTQLPFLPLWLDWRGMSAAQISIISSAPLFVRIIATPVFTFLADRLADHRRVLIALAWAGTASYLALVLAAGFWPIFMLVFLSAIFWTSVMPLTETIAMSGVKNHGLDYGRMRLWGSLSFIAASFIGGFIAHRYGPGSIIWLLGVASVVTVACAHLLPKPAGLGRLRQATTAPKLKASDALALGRSKTFLIFLIAAGLAQSSHGVFYVFGSLHWKAQGLSTNWVGMLWAIGIVTEIALFAFSAAIMARIGAVHLMLLGALAGIVRWSVMGFDPPLFWLLPLQILHGFTYGASHLGAIHFIAAAVADRQAGTAQGLYASITAGLAMGLAFLAAGELYDVVQGQAYFSMAVLSALSALSCLVLMRIWRGDVIAVKARDN